MPSGDLNSLPRASDLPGCCKQMVILSTPLFWLLRDHVLSPHSTPTTPTLLPPVAMQLSQLFLEYAQHTQPGVAKWLSHPPLEYTHHAPPTPLPAVVTSRIPGKCPPCTPFCQLWLRRFSPIPGVRTPRPARCGYVAISPIPGVRPPRPPLCQLWLRGYLVYPWSTHTTPSQVWLFGYLTHPWSTPTTPTSLPAVATWLSRLSLEYAHHARPGVAMWLSHPSLEYAHHAHLSASCGYVAISPILEYAHHAHLSASASCGDVTISLIPGVRTQRPARCGYVAISPIPEVRPPCPPLRLCQLWLSHLFPDHAHHAHPSVSCGYVASHQSLRTPRPARCGYVAISPVPGVRPPRPPLCQLWLRGYLAHPWSTPTTPTSLPLPAVATWLSHLSLEYAHNAQPGVAMWLSHPSPKYAHHAHLSASASCGSLTYPRIMPTTPTLLPAVATWLLINPWSTYTTPSQVCLSHLSLEYAHHAHPLPAVATWLSHLSLEHTHHARSSTSCGYATNPWSTSNAPSHLPGVAMRLSPVSIEYARRAHPLSAAATQLSHLSLKYTHPTASCGYTTSHLALEYAHHAQPAAGVVAMWPSHFSPGGI